MADQSRVGTGQALAAYGIWGLFPLYFAALAPAGAWEVLGHRILGTVLLCLVVLAVLHDWSWVRPFLAQRRLVVGVTVAALCISLNWGFYSAAVLAGQANEAALGYFLNPLVTIALGVLVLRERLRPLQWLAIAIGAAAGVYLIVAAGQVPMVAAVLATSFALYGLIKKRVGVDLSALHSLTAESMVIAPLAIVVLTFVQVSGGATVLNHGPVHAGLFLISGVMTAAPLLLFSAAARRIKLVTIGLIQFVTPAIQLILAVTVLGEHLPRERWIGFGIVWVALIVLSVDMVVSARARPRVTQPV